MLVRFPLGYEMLELCYLSLVHVSRNGGNAVMKKKASGNLWLESWLAVGWLSVDELNLESQVNISSYASSPGHRIALNEYPYYGILILRYPEYVQYVLVTN